jgi:enoyl-CoA hydratase/carnithine racemase
MDLGAEFEKPRGHRFAEAGTAPGHENAPPGKKLIVEHRFHPKELLLIGRLTKSGQRLSVKRQQEQLRRRILMEQRVSISISDGIADVRLVRADKMNALDAAMFDAIVAATERLAHEKGVRAVVLSGEGKSFCAGLDMGRFAAMKETGGNGIAGGEKRDLSVRTHGLTNYPQQAVWGWRQLPVPVIAAIQGVAFGGGFQLALGADMRFLSPDARMSIMEIKWGLVPDMAGTPILASLVRDDILRDLTYTGRIFSAQEALSYGLATRVCDDPRGAAFEVAREIAGKSPDAIRACKRMLNKLSVDPGPALLAESVEQMKLMGSANQLEAVRANIDKRAPRFADVG